ncbi:hypothetical protein GOP47_0000768, partial [Adiantum capillus-veneris]
PKRSFSSDFYGCTLPPPSSSTTLSTRHPFLHQTTCSKQQEVLIVVGGGAAGIFGAIRAKSLSPSLSVLVLEKNPPLAKGVKENNPVQEVVKTKEDRARAYKYRRAAKELAATKFKAMQRRLTRPRVHQRMYPK